MKNFITNAQTLYQIVNFNTRKNNTLDLNFCRIKNIVLNIERLPELGNSDHNVIIGKINNFYVSTESKNKSIYFRAFKNINYEEINRTVNKRFFNFSLI